MSSPGSDASIWRTTFLEDIERSDRHLVVAECAREVIGYGLPCDSSRMPMRQATSRHLATT
jgi:hypothetical protein